nr:MAG TPA: hypothetical protein [Caudoviricetes sp.]
MFFNSSSELSVEKAFFWLIAVFLYVELDINPFVVEDAVPNSPPTSRICLILCKYLSSWKNG